MVRGEQVRSGEGLEYKAVRLYCRTEMCAERKLLLDGHAEKEWGREEKEEEREADRERERKGAGSR